MLLWIRVLNGPENYNPTRPSRSSPTHQHELSARTWPPALLHCFTSYTCYCNFTQRHQVCICPSPWSGSQTYSSSHVNSDDSQQTVHNLQPARNVFSKKGSQRPDPAHLRIFSAQTLPEPAGPVGPGWTAENSTLSHFLLRPSQVLEYERDYMCTKCRHVFTVQADFDQFYTFAQLVACPNPDGCNSYKFSCLSEGSEPAACKDYQEIKIQEQVRHF